MTEDEVLELEDFAFLVEMADRAEHAIAHARTAMEYWSAQIEPLCSEAALPARLRTAYGDIQDDLLEIAKLAEQKEREYHRLSLWDSVHPKLNCPYSSDSSIDAARRVIELINAAEKQLNRALDDLSGQLRDMKHPLNAWKDPDIHLTILLELETSSERRCYQASTPPLCFKLRWSAGQHLTKAHLLGDGQDWNTYRNSDHPFRGLHVGYLAYSLLKWTHVPWQLFGRLRMIRADIEIRGSQTFRIMDDDPCAT